MRTAQQYVGDDADPAAVDGCARQASAPAVKDDTPPLLRLTCREAYAPRAHEQILIDRVIETCGAAGLACPRWLIANYYVSLKTNPLVIVAGAAGTGKADFTRLFATALLGNETAQFALIPGRATWGAGGGEGGYYRSLHERLTSFRFLELLHDAAAAGNSGQLYLVCFQRLHPIEIELYLTSMLQVGEDGQRRLMTPGMPPDRWPIIPPNVRISATVDTPDDPSALSKTAVNYAGVLDFLTRQAPRRLRSLDHLPPPPPGYQRLWLRSVVESIEVARDQLHGILGADGVQRLTPSAPIRNAIWRLGETISGRLLQELTMFVANSFDSNGIGLFDPHDPQRNAQIAYDTQLIQRFRWRVRDGDCPTTAEYFGEPHHHAAPGSRAA